LQLTRLCGTSFGLYLRRIADGVARDENRLVLLTPTRLFAADLPR
jgi:hypothetical protein